MRVERDAWRVTSERNNGEMGARKGDNVCVCAKVPKDTAKLNY